MVTRPRRFADYSDLAYEAVELIQHVSMHRIDDKPLHALIVGVSVVDRYR